MTYIREEIKTDTDDRVIYRNRTLKYLVPIIKTFGENFMILFRMQRWISFGIADFAMDMNYHIPRLFCLLDIENKYNFDRFLKYIKSTAFYLNDYPFDESKHMIVLKFPKQQAYKYFLDGKYSKMYTEEEMDSFVTKTAYNQHGENKYTDIYSVLSKRKAYEEVFLAQLYEDFGTRAKPIKDFEYDYPPILQNEIFNYQLINIFNDENDTQSVDRAITELD